MGEFAGILNEVGSEITKNPGNDNRDSITVLVTSTETVLTLLLDAAITKDEVEVDTYIQNFEYTLETPLGTIEGPFEVFVTGTLMRDEDGTLTGPITIRIVKSELSLAIAETCEFTAVKI